METSIYSDLYLHDTGGWHKLPNWASYFITVGERVALARQSSSRIITAMIVPTRAFATAFVGMGIVLGDATRQDSNSMSAHFEMLFDLPEDTPVIYCDKRGKRYKGRLREPEEIHGEIFVRVQVQNRDGGRLTEGIAESDAWRVQLAEHGGKLPKTQGGRSTQFSDKFVAHFLGSVDRTVEFSLRSKLVCVLVGKKGLLEYEILHTPAVIDAKIGTRAEGKLQDILRVRSFVAANQPYRSALLSVGPRPPSAELINNVEIAVIFDGAPGFLRWGSMWTRCHQVIILDRAEAYLDDAVREINARFSQGRIDAEAALPECDPPPGVEVLAFRAAVK